MLEVKQLFKKLLQVGPGFQKTRREGEGEGRTKDLIIKGRRTKEEGKEEGGGRERQRRERVQAGKPEVKKIQEDRYREKL